MFSENTGYILQIITIACTVGLGLFSAYQTSRIQHGQNIVSVTTSYRMKRSEQLKESGQTLLSNTVPELYDLNEGLAQMLQKAYAAADTISMILHRNFEADKDLIEMAANIADLAYRYGKNGNKDRELYAELVYQRKLFSIKIDVYTGADWNRIKTETKGINTTAESWMEYYDTLLKSFQPELEEIEQEYREAMRQTVNV